MQLPRLAANLRLLGALVALAILPSEALAQGGQGSLGAGVVSREGDAVSYEHIMTPGDSGEWPLSARAGETVIVYVSSNTFDPAVQIVDSAGKVLVENDDIRPGVQDALALYRFAIAGEYKIVVKGFKSAAGGRYTLSLRRFVPTDLRKSERNVGVIGRSRAHWHRFAADVGETLVVAVRSVVFEPEAEIYAPNGERIDASSRILSGGRAVSEVFRAGQKGDFYLRVTPRRDNTGGYAVTVATARVAPLAVGRVTPLRHMDAGGLDLWTLAATAGDVLRVNAHGMGASPTVALRYLPGAGKSAAEFEGSADDAASRLPSDPKASGEMVALIKRTGNYQVEVSQPLGLGVDYTLLTEGAAKPWAADAEPTSKLAIGGSDYWSIDGSAGQIVKLAGIAEPFDIALELYNPQGERVESNDDGAGGHNALVSALLKETGRYLLRVHAFGDGGSGPYRLQRKADAVRPIKIGTRAEGNVGAGTSDIWSFEGKAGQTVILSVRSRDFDTHVVVFGPDAIEIANDDTGLESTDSLLSVRLPLNGRYTVWVSGRAAGGKYIVRLVDGD